MIHCKYCNQEFLPESPKQIYCTPKCKNDNRNLNRRKDVIEFSCLICNNPFIQKRKDNLTCSASCSQKLWVKNNPEKNWERYNGDARKEKSKQWRKENIEIVRAIKQRYKKKRRDNDIIFKLNENVGNGIRSALKSSGSQKNNRTEEILGCSIIDFKLYLESKFDSWMSWDNYGLYKPNNINYG